MPRYTFTSIDALFASFSAQSGSSHSSDGRFAGVSCLSRNGLPLKRCPYVQDVWGVLARFVVQVSDNPVIVLGSPLDTTLLKVSCQQLNALPRPDTFDLGMLLLALSRVNDARKCLSPHS